MLYDAVVDMYNISCVHSPLSQEETYHILHTYWQDYVAVVKHCHPF